MSTAPRLHAPPPPAMLTIRNQQQAVVDNSSRQENGSGSKQFIQESESMHLTSRCALYGKGSLDLGAPNGRP